jgi:hypothetical protein
MKIVMRGEQMKLFKCSKNHIRILTLVIYFSLFILLLKLVLPLSEGYSSSSKINNARIVNTTDLNTTICIGKKKALKWSKNAKLVEISSADDGDKTTGTRGENGCRYSWNMFFTDQPNNKLFFIKILSGKIISEREVQGYPYGSIRLTNIVINSDEALKIAKHYRVLKPGKDWAIGYHFMLTQPKNYPRITVFGYSQDDKFCYVEIDVENGKIISSKKRINKDNQNQWIDY